ncbi:MAG: hypothetical protein LBH48_02640 [Bifidobacteriaceae bacterium]|jgi:hypothetical protein|nr:hypothetical protein [Bifidobacteriaceae bacterium]
MSEPLQPEPVGAYPTPSVPVQAPGKPYRTPWYVYVLIIGIALIVLGVLVGTLVTQYTLTHMDYMAFLENPQPSGIDWVTVCLGVSGVGSVMTTVAGVRVVMEIARISHDVKQLTNRA